MNYSYIWLLPVSFIPPRLDFDFVYNYSRLPIHCPSITQKLSSKSKLSYKRLNKAKKDLLKKDANLVTLCKPILYKRFSKCHLHLISSINEYLSISGYCSLVITNNQENDYNHCLKL